MSWLRMFFYQLCNSLCVFSLLHLSDIRRYSHQNIIFTSYTLYWLWEKIPFTNTFSQSVLFRRNSKIINIFCTTFLTNIQLTKQISTLTKITATSMKMDTLVNAIMNIRVAGNVHVSTANLLPILLEFRYSSVHRRSLYRVLDFRLLISLLITIYSLRLYISSTSVQWLPLLVARFGWLPMTWGPLSLVYHLLPVSPSLLSQIEGEKPNSSFLWPHIAERSRKICLNRMDSPSKWRIDIGGFRSSIIPLCNAKVPNNLGSHRVRSGYCSTDLRGRYP